MRNFLFLIIVFGILFLPLMGLAETYQADSITITYDGLVPCGKCVTTTPMVTASTTDEKFCGATAGTPTPRKYTPCQFCHFFVMLDGILDFLLFKLVLPIAALMLVIAGVLYIGSIFEFLPGGPQTLTQAKGIISSVFTGLFIIFGAWLLLNLFFTLIGLSTTPDSVGEALRTGWSQINCPIKLSP